MDDATETDVLYEACSILMRLSARSIQSIRQDIDHIEIPIANLADQVESSSWTFLPLILTLFSLGLLTMILRNATIQAWGLLISRVLRRWIRKLKVAGTKLVFGLGPIRKSELLHLQLKSPGSTWDLKSNSGYAACFALQGRRPKMEDRFTLVEKLGGTPLNLYAIYDGHGGEFAADFAQRWIVNWLEKRSVHYKASKPAYARQISTPITVPPVPAPPPSPQLPSTPTSSGVQEINPDTEVNEAPSISPETLGSTSNSEVARNIPQQQSQVSGQTEAAVKTPSLKRKQQRQEGQDAAEPQPSPGALSNRRGSIRNSISKPLTSKEKRMSMSAASSGNDFDLSNELNTAIMESDTALIAEAKKHNDVAGSTALVALLDTARGQLTVANVGDSRGILCDAKGTVIPLSFDHKPQQLKERKRIQEAGGFISFNGVWRVAGILATSRALGDFPLKDRKLLIAEPDILSFDLTDLKLHQPSFLILASDGLWDAFSNEEAAYYVRQRLHETHMGAKSLAMQAYQRGSVDNITVLVIDLSKL